MHALLVEELHLGWYSAANAASRVAQHWHREPGVCLTGACSIAQQLVRFSILVPKAVLNQNPSSNLLSACWHIT